MIDRKKTDYKVWKGPKFSTTVVQEETDITHDLLTSGAWKTASFKKYNFDALGVSPNGGFLHPLLKVREEFRQIFFELGYAHLSDSRFVN